MSAVNQGVPGARELVKGLHRFIEDAVKRNGGSTKANKPGHRLSFHWPPHPISYSYHVLASDWSGRAEFEAYGETFGVEVARTPYGVFGRSTLLWHEARGETLEEMLNNLKEGAEPLFKRQLLINECLGQPGRFQGHLADLPPEDMIKLLYCRDRDVANDAHTHLEIRASLGIFGPALVEILKDRRHPDRRSAQWCVLDLFEDLPSFCHTPEERFMAIRAIRDLLWDADDDYARTIYKAGVVLGGHMPEETGGAILLECLQAPSKIGRRAAIHGLFHVVEWYPRYREEVLDALEGASKNDPDPLLRAYATGMRADISAGNYDHLAEPVFPEEN